MGRGLVRNFHTRCLYQKSHSLAALARSISDTSPTRAKIPYAPPAHEVISMFYSTFYKTKLLSRILTLVNFSSERDKTLFSGGTRRKAWDTLPPLPPDYFQINRRPPGIRTFLRSRHFIPPLTSRSGWFGPPTIASSVLSFQVPDSIYISPGKVLTQNGCHELEEQVLKTQLSLSIWNDLM